MKRKAVIFSLVALIILIALQYTPAKQEERAVKKSIQELVEPVFEQYNLPEIKIDLYGGNYYVLNFDFKQLSDDEMLLLLKKMTTYDNIKIGTDDYNFGFIKTSNVGKGYGYVKHDNGFITLWAGDVHNKYFIENPIHYNEDVGNWSNPYKTEKERSNKDLDVKPSDDASYEEWDAYFKKHPEAIFEEIEKLEDSLNP